MGDTLADIKEEVQWCMLLTGFNLFELDIWQVSQCKSMAP